MGLNEKEQIANFGNSFNEESRKKITEQEQKEINEFLKPIIDYNNKQTEKLNNVGEPYTFDKFKKDQELLKKTKIKKAKLEMQRNRARKIAKIIAGIIIAGGLVTVTSWLNSEDIKDLEKQAEMFENIQNQNKIEQSLEESQNQKNLDDAALMQMQQEHYDSIDKDNQEKGETIIRGK